LRALALVVLCTGCAGVQPKQEPAQRSDAVELFRRARFKELSQLDKVDFFQLVQRLRPKALSTREDYFDSLARAAYRHGDGKTALEAVESLPEANRTRSIIGALLSHADTQKKLFEASFKDQLIRMPLDHEALAAGHAVIRAQIRAQGQTSEARLLWDTGATENVLSEDLAEAMRLDRQRVQMTLNRTSDALIVRFAATSLDEVLMPGLSFHNVPTLVSELHTVTKLQRTTGIDGFLSPQMLVREGCFAIDRAKEELSIGMDGTACESLITRARNKEPLFAWDGEVYVNARIHESPEVAVRLETGSPVTYLRVDAARYLPKGSVNVTPEEAEGDIASDLGTRVSMSCAGQSRSVSAIELEPRRQTIGHDDLGTIGTDLLLAGRGVVVSFYTMELGLLAPEGGVSVR
jgi:hypothetical protein